MVVVIDFASLLQIGTVMYWTSLARMPDSMTPGHSLI